MFDCKYDNENFRRKPWLRSTKNDNSSCERAHAIFRWASTIFCWASTCQFLITRLLIGQRASYNRFFHWLFPDANDGSNDRTKDHRSFPNMKLPTAAKIRYKVSLNRLEEMIWKLISKRGVQENLLSTAIMWLDFLLLRFMVISVFSLNLVSCVILKLWKTVIIFLSRSCPVCRYSQTPQPVDDNKCFECDSSEVRFILQLF